VRHFWRCKQDISPCEQIAALSGDRLAPYVRCAKATGDATNFLEVDLDRGRVNKVDRTDDRVLSTSFVGVYCWVETSERFADSYADDMSVFSENWTSHLEHLEKFLQTIREASLTLNPKKCNFVKGKVKF
jgi:hypothetical protein